MPAAVPHLFCWADLSPADVERCYAAQSNQELRALVQELCGLAAAPPAATSATPSTGTDNNSSRPEAAAGSAKKKGGAGDETRGSPAGSPQPPASVPHSTLDEITADLYFHLLVHCRQWNFTHEKASAFFTLAKLTHSQNVGCPYNNMNEVFDFFKAQLLRHSVQRPPFSEGVFTLEDSKLVLQYMLDTYFTHYKLYKYAFAAQPRLNLHFAYSNETEDDAKRRPAPQTPQPSAADTAAAAQDQPPSAEDKAGAEPAPAAADGEQAGEQAGEPAPDAVPADAAAAADAAADTLVKSAAAKQLEALVQASLEARIEQIRAQVEDSLTKQESDAQAPATTKPKK